MSDPGDQDWFVLVRHAAPLVERGRSDSDWPLSPGGREAALKLAMQLQPLASLPLFCSPQLKARETAQILRPDEPLRLEDDLTEHGRGPIDYLPARAFGDAIEAFFERFDSVVFGAESAAAAAQRLTGAVERLCRAPAILVTHGRIISAYLSTLLGSDGLAIWRGLRMPDALLVRPRERRVQGLDVSE